MTWVLVVLFYAGGDRVTATITQEFFTHRRCVEAAAVFEELVQRHAAKTRCIQK